MKGKQLKVVSAGVGAAAVVAMGALGVALSESPSADIHNVSTGIEQTLGSTSTETTAPTDPETTLFTPPVEVELPEGYGPPE